MLPAVSIGTNTSDLATVVNAQRNFQVQRGIWSNQCIQIENGTILPEERAEGCCVRVTAGYRCAHDLRPVVDGRSVATLIGAYGSKVDELTDAPPEGCMEEKNPRRRKEKTNR